MMAKEKLVMEMLARNMMAREVLVKEMLVKEKLARKMLVKEMLVMEGEGGGKVGKEVGICEKGIFLIDSLFLAANK